MTRALLALLALLVAAGAGCGREPTPDELNRHPARRLATYGDVDKTPLAGRIAPAPPAVVDYVRLDNRTHHIPSRPRAYALAPAERAAVDRALADIPPRIRALAARSLVGIFFVEGLGSSGFTETVDSAPGLKDRTFMVFDREVFRRPANAWAGRKEASPFRQGGRHRVSLMIEEPASDDLTGSFRFILLHELGHVVGMATRSHPDWDHRPRPGEHPFNDRFWSGAEVQADAVFPLRPQLHFYARPADALPAERIPEAYETLQKTDFPTLYAATNVFDDFAESFASYVHVALLKRPYEVTIWDGDRAVARYPAGILLPRCRAKREFMEGLLGALPAVTTQ